MRLSLASIARVAVVAAAVFVVACGGGSVDNSGGTSSQTTAGKDTTNQQRVAKVTIGFPTDPGSALNPYVTAGYQFDNLMELVFDKLFSPSPYVDEPQPWLAESAKSIDAKTWEVKIRKGVTWHDGTPFTADDVKFTYEFYRDGPQNRYTHHVNDVPKVDTIDKLDETTLRFNCNYACPSLARITFADLPILQKKQWVDVKAPAQMTAMPVGTGPYKLTEYTPGQLLRFKANDTYFAGKPMADEIVVPLIKDANAIFTALRSGEIDISARPLPPELTSQFATDKTFKVAKTQALEIVELRQNFEIAPFNNPQFRGAISNAIDRKSIVDTVLLGEARAGLQGYPHPDSPWTKPGISTPFDANASKAAFDKLGYKDTNNDGLREMPDGKPMAFSLVVPSNQPIWLRAGELVVKQLAAVGVKATLQSSDPQVIAALVRDRAYELQISIIGAHGVADPDQFIMSNKSGYLWRTGVAYPEWDALWTEWQAAQTIEARKQVSFKMQELFNKQPTSIALWYSEESVAYRPGTYDGWVESRGYGIINKWSFLPADARAKLVMPRKW